MPTSPPPSRADTHVDSMVDSAPPTAVQAPLLGGRYELLAMIGAGGAGTVYRARDIELDEIVAVKTLRRTVLDAKDIQALRREVKLARRVTHKNVARVFDIGEHAGQRFLTMELIAGAPLTRIVGGPQLPIARAARMAKSIADGLAAAHEAGVIHRDLKPANVLVETTGRVVITDFGIARRSDGEGPKSNSWEGTPIYMAPEQLTGDEHICGRADLYALGEILYELLTGVRAWQGDGSPRMAMTRLTSEPPDPRERRPDVPRELAELVVRLLARDRTQRPETAGEVAEALDAFTSFGSARATISAMPRELKVAVLPFDNDSREDDHLSDGFTDDLVATLSTTESLRVRPRSLVMRYKRSGVDPVAAGRELGVDVVVAGSMRHVPESKLSVSVRVIVVNEGRELWTKTCTAPTAGLLLACDDAARAIGEVLATAVVAPARRAVKDATAIDLYLRARQELAKQAYGGRGDAALELLEEALRREPDEPNILAAYAVARSRITHTPENARLALESAERATRLAPHLAEGWLALAIVHQMSTDLAGTLRASARALRCSPHLAKAHHLVGDVMTQIGLTDEGIRRCELALALDPTIAGTAITLAAAHAHRGDRARAEAMLDHPSNADPPLSWIALGTRARIAIWNRERIDLPGLPDGTSPSLVYARFITEVARTGTVTPEAKQSMRSQRSVTTRLFRALAAQLECESSAYAGSTDDALESLSFSDANGLVDLMWLDNAPVFDRLRDHPQFVAVRAQVAERAQALEEVIRNEALGPTTKS